MYWKLFVSFDCCFSIIVVDVRFVGKASIVAASIVASQWSIALKSSRSEDMDSSLRESQDCRISGKKPKDCALDIEAAVDLMRNEGLRKIVNNRLRGKTIG